MVVAAGHVKPKRRALAMAGAILAPATIAAVALGMWAVAPPSVHVLAVGNGQALLFRSTQGVILVDGGPSPARLKDELGQILPPWQTSMNAVVITAPGLGHVGGIAAGLDRPARSLVIPDAQLSGSAWRTAAFEAVARGASVVRTHAGQEVDAAGFRLVVPLPQAGLAGSAGGAPHRRLRVVAPSG